MNLAALGRQHHERLTASVRTAFTPPGETPVEPAAPQPAQAPPGPPPADWQGAYSGPTDPRPDANTWLRQAFTAARG